MSAGAFGFVVVLASLVALLIVFVVRENKRQYAKYVAAWNDGICSDCGTIWEYAGSYDDDSDMQLYKCICGRGHGIWVSASVAKNPRKIPRLFVLQRSLAKCSKANDITTKEYEYFKSILDALPEYPNVMEHLELFLAPSRYSMRLSMRLSWESPKLSISTLLKYPTITYELDGKISLYVEGKLNTEPCVCDPRKAFDDFSMAVCG